MHEIRLWSVQAAIRTLNGIVWRLRLNHIAWILVFVPQHWFPMFSWSVRVCVWVDIAFVTLYRWPEFVFAISEWTCMHWMVSAISYHTMELLRNHSIPFTLGYGGSGKKRETFVVMQPDEMVRHGCESKVAREKQWNFTCNNFRVPAFAARCVICTNRKWHFANLNWELPLPFSFSRILFVFPFAIDSWQSSYFVSLFSLPFLLFACEITYFMSMRLQ